MKKTLSLKKKAAPSKQLQISNFFGNASNSPKLSPQEAVSETKVMSTKRKAASPPIIDLDVNFDEQNTDKHNSRIKTIKKSRVKNELICYETGFIKINDKIEKTEEANKERNKYTLASVGDENISAYNSRTDITNKKIHEQISSNITPKKSKSKDSKSRLSLIKKSPKSHDKEQKNALSFVNESKLDSNNTDHVSDKIIAKNKLNVILSPKKGFRLSPKRKLSFSTKNKQQLSEASLNQDTQSLNQKEQICNMNIKKCNDKLEKSSEKNDSKKDLHTSPSALSNGMTSLELTTNMPSQSGSSINEAEFSYTEMEDMFEDDFDLDLVEDTPDDLDLTNIQRCEVVAIIKHHQKLELKLKNNMNNRGTCFVEGNWLNTPLQAGEIISILASRDTSAHFAINNTQGLLVLRPDHLISSTSVVSGVFCRRKAVLQERFKGIDSANTAMTIGILIHELVQKALTQNISNVSQLRCETVKIIKESIDRLYASGIYEEEARTNMEVYIEPLAEFIKTYVVNKSKNHNVKKGQWNGKVDKVLDVEENVCCPQLGLKGKIDATLQVTIHNRKEKSSAIVPLELKSGRASVSAEHTGQLVMYSMMMSVLGGGDPAREGPGGLLLYLKDQINITEVSCDYPKRRDLVMLRNELVQHLAPGPNDVSPDEITDIEDLSVYHQSLPEPVHNHSACSKCAYLSLCSLHLWHTDGLKVAESHPLARLRGEALGHLTPRHVRYVLRWASLLRLDERAQLAATPLHALWTDHTDTRSKRGSCAANLILTRVTMSDDRYLHVFVRNGTDSENLIDSKYTKGPQEGDFSIVSIENRPWVAAGVVTLTSHTELQILLERDLSCRLPKSTKFHVDTYESYGTTVHNLTNLGQLIEDTHQASRLRKIIIDKEPPEFVQKLPPRLHEVGQKLLSTLNKEQQKAILKVLKSSDYVLLQGLPGTGKTQTLSVLIQLLCALGRRVLVTAHTHSAVDTLLARLPPSLRVLRASSRAGAPAAVAACGTVDELTTVYNSMQVVGVTCLGATHPLFTKTTFDFCIVDEATQVLQCTVLRPLFAAVQFVLVGDPEQLPPVVRSKDAKRLGMEVSLFHRLMRDDSTVTLSLQYRMNQPLADLANKVAYNNRLKCANECVAKASLNANIQKLSKCASDSQWLVTACSPKPEDAAIFFNTKLPPCDTGGHKTLSNKDEAVVVLALIDILNEAGVQASDIGVIAPYRDQVALLRRTVAGTEVDVSTVDQFQGRDKSVIIYSCTRKEYEGRKVKDNEVLNDKRRLAVSVTRAKHKFIVIGNMRALQQYTSLMSLVAACRTVDLEEDLLIQLNNKYKVKIV